MDNYLLKCSDCSKPFFTEGEKKFYEEHKLTLPTRCKDCRKKRKRQREVAENKLEIENLIRDLTASGYTFTKLSNVIDHVDKKSVLFIIGNGFDIFHGVKSSYYNFGATIGKNNHLRMTMEWIINCDDLWGDFEGNLARVSRESLMTSVETLIDMVEVQDPDDDDFSAAEYFASIDNGLSPINELQYDLPKRFRQWVNGLSTSSAGSNEVRRLFSSAESQFLTFNYTDFLESIYGIAANHIKYIHGCRKNKGELILGHGENPDRNFEEWQEQNKDRFRVHEHRWHAIKRKNGHIAHPMQYESMTELAYFDPEPEKGNWVTPIRYYALEPAVQRIEEYFEDSRKKTEQIIIDNEDWFQSMASVTDIVVLGHSLMPVDYPYFQKLNVIVKDAFWHITWYSAEDLKRIKKFTEGMGIKPERVELFQLE